MRTVVVGDNETGIIKYRYLPKIIRENKGLIYINLKGDYSASLEIKMKAIEHGRASDFMHIDVPHDHIDNIKRISCNDIVIVSYPALKLTNSVYDDLIESTIKNLKDKKEELFESTIIIDSAEVLSDNRIIESLKEYKNIYISSQNVNIFDLDINIDEKIILNTMINSSTKYNKAS